VNSQCALDSNTICILHTALLTNQGKIPTILTNDKKVAKLILSKLIGKEVIELYLDSTEVLTNKKKRKPAIGSKESYTVMRLDFAAKIRNQDGTEELILIELQKAKLITDIMRFRKYLGSQYMNKDHHYVINGKTHALPIYPIYFLGHKLEGFTQEVIAIKRDLYNGLTNEKIENKCEFADSLSHDGLIIQIPHVPKNIESSKNRDEY
jgi:hypothetical protein